MAIDPNAIDPKSIKKLIVEGLVFGSDGSMRAERVKTSDDPAIAQREMKALSDTATAWRQVHDFTKGMDDETFARREAEALKLCDEMLGMAATTQPVAVVASVPAPANPAATLAQAYADYMKSKANIAAATITAYNGSFELFAILVGGAHPLAQSTNTTP